MTERTGCSSPAAAAAAAARGLLICGALLLPQLLFSSAASKRRSFSVYAFLSTYASTKSPPIMDAIANDLLLS